MIRLHLIALVCFLPVLFTGCAPDEPAPAETILYQYNGETMGTTYNITAVADANVSVSPKKLKLLTDAWLVKVNESLSTYIDTSIISRINASTDTSVWHPVDQHFVTVFEQAKAIHTTTEGAFNPALGPLITAWGFGASEPVDLSPAEVTALLQQTDFGTFTLQDSSVKKTNPASQLDFSAIAKGYGVDVVASLLERQGIAHYFVEIGGEVRTKGLHPENRLWRSGIDKPSFESSPVRELQAAINLDNEALATSGNYRNFYVRDGQKYVHTINPATGYPEESDLLSVSVIGPDCMTADAFATAFMVLGKDRAYALATATAGIEAYFITSDGGDGFDETMTAGFPEAQPMDSAGGALQKQE